MTLYNVILEADPPRAVALSDTALAGHDAEGRVHAISPAIGKVFALPALPAVIVGQGYWNTLIGLYLAAAQAAVGDELTELGPALAPIAQRLVADQGGGDCELGPIQTCLVLAGWSRRHRQAAGYVYTTQDGGRWGERFTAGQITAPQVAHAADFTTADAATAVALARVQWAELGPALRGSGGYGGKAIIAEIDGEGMRLTEAWPFDSGQVLARGGVRGFAVQPAQR